jgi:uncharacterized 2Fe-2S/4Fe-4S cluster protein (DUF4445 family)
MDAAKLLGVDLITICGGEGKCGKCKVIIAEEKENAGSITEIERSLLSNKELSSGYRLACCAAVVGPLNVIIPEKSRTGKQRLQTEGIDTPVQLEPFIKKFYVKLPSPTLQDSKSDVDRLLNELFSRHQLQNLRVEYDLLMRLPHVLRNEAWKATATVWGENLIIDVDSGDTRDRNYGYAVDIGTTKLAGYLLSLNTGKIIAVGSLMNPQISFGEDLITRISHATKGSEKAKDLQQAVVSGINQILMEICQKVDINPNEIYEMTAVGNTGMHHLFLRLNPKYLSLSPYPPIIRDSLNVEPDKIGVNINPNGNIHFLPVIAGFVGADTVAVILSTEIYKRDELCFAVDIGTNTEIVLGNKNRILACSCASGPAFEGAHIKHGMRAATGAIEKVKISPKTFDVQYQTIENAKPRGICGSALVDIPAEMLKAGIIDVAGTMNRELDTPRLRRGKDGFEFVLAWKKETSTKGDIIVTQKDIRELQLAKGAMHTGASLLMEKEGVTERDIDVAFIAGAFGFYIDPKSARTIGMYPEFQLEKIKMVGNAAGTGARMAIISKNARETAKDISRKVKYVEIAAEPSFHAEFLNSQYLPYADLSKYPETSALLKRLGKYPTKRIPVF